MIVSLQRRRQAIDRFACYLAAGHRTAKVVAYMLGDGYGVEEIAAAETYILTVGAARIHSVSTAGEVLA